MGMPEFVILNGIQKAWDFLTERTFVLGHFLRELPANRQEEYRNLIATEKPNIHLGFPNQKTRLPSFSLLLSSENEGVQVVGDTGLSDVDPPYPAVAPDDYDDPPEYYGVTYDQFSGSPNFLGYDGNLTRPEPRNHPLPRKNLDIQNADGDEQFERMGEVQRLWARDQQRLQARVVSDNVSVGILVTTENAEKTFVYYRLLRSMLRRFTMWFEVNGVQNPQYSGADLSPVETMLPTVSGVPVFQRQLSMSFMYEDRLFEVESLIRGWVYELVLATERPDGGLDEVTVVEVAGNALLDDEDT